VSTAILAGHYDEVLDAQKHYRTLLDCTARPGTIGQLDDVAMELPSQYNHATALIVMALFGGDTTFHLAEPEGQGLERESEFIRSVSGAKPVAAEEADFLVFFHAEDLQKSEVRTGTLAYPETGATVIAQVESLSPAPTPGSLRLRLTGPGIETEAVVFVTGAAEPFFAHRADLNAEFPIGFDLFLTCDSLSAGPCVLALPRTTRVAWERI
jgi:alpha-D-ribose 1-methylphosphonate 5-triphosphate synthase subunit PhnH